MIVKELIDKLKGYSGDLFVITQASYCESDYTFSFPNYSVVTDVYIEDDWLVRISDCKRFRCKPSLIKPMTVKEVINELSKYSPDLGVQTEVFDSTDFLCYGMVNGIIDDIAKVSCDEDNNIVILNSIEHNYIENNT